MTTVTVAASLLVVTHGMWCEDFAFSRLLSGRRRTTTLTDDADAPEEVDVADIARGES